MTDEAFKANNHSESAGVGSKEQRRLLELELTKIRNEASAARLDAKAAEIEMMLRRNGSRASENGTASSGTPIDDFPQPTSGHHLFSSWDEVRKALPLINVTDPVPSENVAVAEVPIADEDRVVRADAAEPSVRRPRFLDFEQDATESSVSFASEDLSGILAVASEFDEQPGDSRRSRSAAWILSGAVHALILFLLAAVGIQAHRPKDQVAITGSSPDVSEVSMETFEMESSEPESEPTETTPSEVEYALSPVGKVAVTEISSDSPPAPPSPTTASMSNTATAAAMSLKSNSDAKIQFCGVEGGGNHFVYLVDSSGSMKEGFQSARRELLASIEALTPEQRFYVVFYDSKPDYMRLHNAGEDEPRSVYATPENKAALRRWAMQVSMDRGKAPNDPLRFALGLKADVIFLLSDGEFPQKTEDLLKEENKVANLFGDSGPISIVHTISYHSKEGESRMRRIAQQNQGQYRYVPKP